MDSVRTITPFSRRRNLITKWATVSKFRSSSITLWRNCNRELFTYILHCTPPLFHPQSTSHPWRLHIMKNILLANSITIFIKLVPPFEQEQILVLLHPSVKCETKIKSSPHWHIVLRILYRAKESTNSWHSHLLICHGEISQISFCVVLLLLLRMMTVTAEARNRW